MMETTVNSGMCRCCASEGLFKDVNSAYRWMGEDEIYADMLQFCFDISLSTAEDQNNGGICEVCITQLRNAANFKKQVLHTEEQFKKIQEQKTFRPELVKVEMPIEDDESDNNLTEDYHSGADLDLAIKEESPEPKTKKRATKATTSRAKKAKLDTGETSTKRVQRAVDVKTDLLAILNGSPEPIVKEDEEELISLEKLSKRCRKEELQKHYANIRLILQYSNATPIGRHGGIGYMCSFCADQYSEPADLKRHTLENHKGISTASFTRRHDLNSYCVKLDITGLRCKLCQSDIANTEQLIEHLQNHHKENLHTDIKSHIISFKFDSADTLRCHICSNEFVKFKMLLEHMNIHCRNYVCDVCDAGYVNLRKLMTHTEVHKTGLFACDYCPKVFNTLQKKKSHEKCVHTHSNVLNKCCLCGETFRDYRKKEAHMIEAHGTRSLTLKCHACEKTFTSQKAHRIHTKRDHLLERRHVCTECEMRFFSSTELKEHMVKHTGVRNYRCGVCSKSYGRKWTLKEHMRIHEDDKRFGCEHCGQAFVQKCSWRGHMRAKHGVLLFN